MPSALHDAPVPDDEDQVGSSDRRQSVGNDKGGATLEGSIESTLHLTRCWVSDALLGELPPGAEIVA